MRSFLTKSAFICLFALLLSGCEKNVNLADDIDLQVKKTSPTPFMPQITQQMPEEVATVSANPMELYAEIVTAAGKIKIKLFPKEAPNTVKNFLTKIRSGFYSGLTFHRVENWVIQGGDPQGTGRGGGTMPTELSQTPFKEGSVGVARGGEITISNDSQFFICTSDCSWLTGQYTLFGEVISGMEVAKQVTKGMTIDEIVEVAN